MFGSFLARQLPETRFPALAAIAGIQKETFADAISVGVRFSAADQRDDVCCRKQARAADIIARVRRSYPTVLPAVGRRQQTASCRSRRIGERRWRLDSPGRRRSLCRYRRAAESREPSSGLINDRLSILL